MRPAAEAVLVAATARVEPRQLRVTAILCDKKYQNERGRLCYVYSNHTLYIYIYMYVYIDLDIEIEIAIDR